MLHDGRDGADWLGDSDALSEDDQIDLRAYIDRPGSIHTFGRVDWIPIAAIRGEHSTLMVQVQRTGQYWIHHGSRWIGPFIAEDAACAALRLLL